MYIDTYIARRIEIDLMFTCSVLKPLQSCSLGWDKWCCLNQRSKIAKALDTLYYVVLYYGMLYGSPSVPQERVSTFLKLGKCWHVIWYNIIQCNLVCVYIRWVTLSAPRACQHFLENRKVLTRIFQAQCIAATVIFTSRHAVHRQWASSGPVAFRSSAKSGLCMYVCMYVIYINK